MTATAEMRPRSASIGTPRARPQRQKTIEEQHPEAMKRQFSRSEEKFKTLHTTFENISEAEEDVPCTSECSSGSSTSLDGPSPYAVRQDERYWYCGPTNQSTFFSHPLISPKFGRRSLNNSPVRLQRGFSDPIVRRKRSLPSMMDRLSCGSYDQLSSDFLNLPPIPEVAPGNARDTRGDSSNSVEDESDYDDSSECSDRCGSA